MSRHSARNSPWYMIVVGAIFCLLGGVFLALFLPGYLKVTGAETSSLSKLSSLPPGAVIKVPVTVSQDNLLTAKDGQKLIYEHVKLERRTGSGKNESIKVEKENRSPLKVTVSDGTASVDIPCELIDDNFVERMGPFKQDSTSFDKAALLLIPEFSEYGEKGNSHLELAVAWLPANQPMTLIASRSDQPSGIKVAAISDGAIKTGIILTHKSAGEILNQMMLGVIAIAIFLVAGIIFLAIGGFQFIRRIA